MVNVNPLTGLYSGASSQLQNTAKKVQSTISALVGGSAAEARNDVSGISIAAQLQTQISSLKSAAGNITQSLSLAQVADGAVSRQLEIVGRLQELATQANSGVLDDASRRGLDIEFQGLVNELNRIGNNTQFNGTRLLDGSLNLSLSDALGNSEGGPDAALQLPDTSATSLFEGQNLNLLTQDAASNAQVVLANVQQILQESQVGVGSFLQSLDFAAANLQSAIFNQEAARSSIDDADFAVAATQLSQLSIKNNAQLAVQAQSNKLTPTVLDLLNAQINSGNQQ